MFAMRMSVDDYLGSDVTESGGEGNLSEAYGGRVQGRYTYGKQKGTVAGDIQRRSVPMATVTGHDYG
jgi:hypothetical protein